MDSARQGRVGKPCAEPRCPEVIAEGKYCAKHAPEHKQELQAFARKKVERLPLYNSAAWKRTRAAKLAQTPTCERCNRALATVVHHVTMARDGPEQHFREDNLEALCVSCHARESQRESRQNRQSF